MLFIIVQIINLLAIAATIFLTKRSDQICPYHMGVAFKDTKI